MVVVAWRIIALLLLAATVGKASFPQVPVLFGKWKWGWGAMGGGVGEMKWALLLTYEFWYGRLLVERLGVGVGRCPKKIALLFPRKGMSK